MLRSMFHIEKYLAHGIKDSRKEKDLVMAKRLIRYMFFQNEKQIVEIKLEKITSLYGYDSIISNFLSFLKRHPT